MGALLGGGSTLKVSPLSGAWQNCSKILKLNRNMLIFQLAFPQPATAIVCRWVWWISQEMFSCLGSTDVTCHGYHGHGFCR